VVVLTLDGAVSPGAADYLVRGLRSAEKRGAGLVIVRMDTPGGLDTSMRLIIREILASPVPVAAYVAPSGARAASAGTYMLYASHIAAMAPATNLGAATPIALGGGGGPQPARDKSAKDGKDGKQDKEEPGAGGGAPERKLVNDAAAYIRGLAQMRGRNADWAERAVREAVSLSAEEARKADVIEVLAASVRELLQRVDGMKVSTPAGERVLATAGAEVIEIEPDWRTRLLMIIANPSIAMVLMMIGIYGLIFEFANPGFVVPGVVGAICLLLAFYGLHLLPVNYAGLALVLIGIAFVVGEAFMPSFGVLGIGGIAAIVIGSVILIDPESAPGLTLSWPFIMGYAAASAGLLFATVVFALRARRQPVVSGREDLIGARGIALEDIERGGWARVRGERWRVESSSAVKRDDALRVVGISGLVLQVEPERKGERQ
jgi:membrane-bound serine protease (ClpP class)